jgi:RNA methyltransferase, TrmH family
MPTKLGAHSPRLEAVRALLTTKGRHAQGRFTIEGPTMLREAFASGTRLEAVYATDAAFERDPVLHQLDDGRVFIVPERALQRLSALQTPPGIVGVAPTTTMSLGALLARDGAVLALAGVNDPGNAGTLLRSAEIFGVRDIVFARGAVEPYHPKVVRASMGAIFRLALAVADGSELSAAASLAGRPIVAADLAGEPVCGFDFPDRLVLVVGHERRGVAGWLPRWDRRVTIPHAGKGQSLNAAVAGSIILYERIRRRP